MKLNKDAYIYNRERFKQIMNNKLEKVNQFFQDVPSLK